jgi:hypothetical protein
MIGTMENSIFAIYEIKHMKNLLCNLISCWLIYFEQFTISPQVKTNYTTILSLGSM